MRHFPTPGRSAAVWLACMALAATTLVGCTRSVAGSPVKPTGSRTVDLEAALLDASEINGVMDATDLEMRDKGDAPNDDPSEVDPPECHGLVYIAGDTEYAATDFIAMRWQTLASPAAGTVIQSLTQVPSAAMADEFVETQTTAWEECEDVLIKTTEKDAPPWRNTLYRIDSVSTKPQMVISQSHVVTGQMPCQHVLKAANDVIIEVSACGNNVSDQAEQIADKLADKVG